MQTNPSYGQPWQLTLYAEDAGLGQQRVFDIAFEPDGVVWLAADNGLHRFDGFTWRHFGTNEGLPSVFVRALLVNKQGQLWVGTDKGAGIFDATRLKFDSVGSEAGLANQNVRQIAEDPDGTLWFSCDRWPDSQVKPGGLSCLKDGVWQTYSRTNGLPMDYVIGYFRDSTGRQFAMTPHGWVQRQGEHWELSANPGYEAENQVLQMAEADDGTLFAQGENTLLTLIDGRWRKRSSDLARLMCRTRAGELMAMEFDRELDLLWFSRWDGGGFGRLSAGMDVQSGARFYHLREAPDGSLWGVGKGIVVRWGYHDERWEAYPQLPKIIGSDRLGRMWFARNTNVVVCVSNQFLVLPPGKLVGWNENGTALIWNDGQKRLEVTDPQEPSQRTPLDVELAGVDYGVDYIRADDGDGFWIVGHSQTNEWQLAHYQHGRTVKIDAAPLQNCRMVSATSASSGQLWVVAQTTENTQLGLALVTDETVEWQPLQPAPPQITYGHWWAGAGRHWLCGYAGIYAQLNPPTGEWRPVTNTVSEGFSDVLAGSNEVLFTFSGGRSGRSGAALFSSNRWETIYGDFSNPTFAKDKQKLFMASHNGIYIRKTPGTLELDHLRMPGGSRVHLTVENQNGDLWLGTSDGVLRYRPGRTPPQPRIVANATEVLPEHPLPVVFGSLSRFERESNPRDFYYSWRIDNQSWSPFEPWPQSPLRLPASHPGQHLLEVKSRDVDGNVSVVPAQLSFTILPDPLQQRAWFYPLLALLASVLAWLGWQRVAHVRKIARTNAILRQEIMVRQQAETELERARAELEHRVIERTGQLTRSNKQLQHEIAERKQAEEFKFKLEEQLHQSRKMEAIGTLAGGIAHDFNNLLAIIIPYCDLVKEEVASRPDLQEHLQEVLKAANRAKNLVQQILTFSRRQQQQQRAACHLQPVVKEALKLLRAALPSSIQMVQKISPTHPVLTDPTQIHQVVMNLCVNAQHALEGRQGEVEVRLDEMLVDEMLCERHADLRPGLYVRLAVRDTGCGISAEHLKRIFEPFFTTRDVGQGTGLGLAVVHGIVQNNDGAILVQSELGRGTEFQVLLPALLEAVDQIDPAIQPPSRSNGEHILVVDDEEAIVKVLKRLLTRAGYKVTAHVDPLAALQDFIARPADINLILTDFTMPGLNGMELAVKVREIRPELPVIIATGFCGDLITQTQLAECPNIRKVVEKPLTPEAIIRLVAELLPPAGPA